MKKEIFAACILGLILVMAGYNKKTQRRLRKSLKKCRVWVENMTISNLDSGGKI
jgi:hypothetical protein